MYLPHHSFFLEPGVFAAPCMHVYNIQTKNNSEKDHTPTISKHAFGLKRGVSLPILPSHPFHRFT